MTWSVKELAERLEERARHCEANLEVCAENGYEAEEAHLQAEATDLREAAAKLVEMEARDAQRAATAKLIADNLSEYIDKNGGTVDVTIALAFETARALSEEQGK